MLRFLGMIWDDASPQQNEAAQLIAAKLQGLSATWRQEFSAPGLRVFCADTISRPPRVYRLPEDAGIIIGAAFARSRDILSSSPDQPIQLGPQQAAAFVQSRGRWLIDHCWGNYVAFGRDGAAGAKWVLKDPTGSLPCIRTDFRGVTIFFSRMADCLGLNLLRFSINPEFLNAHVVAGSSLQELSALNEIAPMRRGECVEFSKINGAWHSGSHIYWNPLRFSGSEDLIEDAELGARAIRNTVKAATASWASLHDSLLLRLSGGLDSSIIAGCLKDVPNKPRFVAYTYYSPNGRSDERPWARLAGQHSGCEHVEYPVSPSEMDLRAGLAMDPAPEPSPLLGYLQRTTVEQQLAARTSATAIFNGEGGDSGFCSDSVSYAVPDYLRYHGFTPGVFRLASRVALLTEKSSWSVLISALGRRLLSSEIVMPRERLLEACQLVSADLKQAFHMNGTSSHPWFKDERRTPWDKIRRLGTLISTPDYYNVTADADDIVPELVSPLYAQPVMELLLRIPIYTHFDDGRDRGLARRAFADDVPEPILRRLWKDRAPGFHDELLARHRSFLQETLLDGVLASNGLLDRRMVEEALSSRPSKSPVYPGELFRHLDTELWARHWRAPARSQAAAD